MQVQFSFRSLKYTLFLSDQTLTIYYCAKAQWLRIHISRFFSDFKNVTFYTFWNSMSKSRLQKFSPQSFEMTAVNMNNIKQPKDDHQDLSSIFPKNWLVKLKIWLGYDANIITQQDVWCWWLTSTDFWWLCIKLYVHFLFFFQNPKTRLFTFSELLRVFLNAA